MEYTNLLISSAKDQKKEIKIIDNKPDTDNDEIDDEYEQEVSYIENTKGSLSINKLPNKQTNKKTKQKWFNKLWNLLIS
jgi:hypothetical protein